MAVGHLYVYKDNFANDSIESYDIEFTDQTVNYNMPDVAPYLPSASDETDCQLLYDDNYAYYKMSYEDGPILRCDIYGWSDPTNSVFNKSYSYDSGRHPGMVVIPQSTGDIDFLVCDMPTNSHWPTNDDGTGHKFYWARNNASWQLITENEFLVFLQSNIGDSRRYYLKIVSPFLQYYLSQQSPPIRSSFFPIS